LEAAALLLAAGGGGGGKTDQPFALLATDQPFALLGFDDTNPRRGRAVASILLVRKELCAK